MTSYMVYKPPSPLRAYAGRPRPVTSHHARATSEHLTSPRASDDFQRPMENTVVGPGTLARATTIAISSTGVQAAQRFEHDIPDHILQSWPLVHKVHSQRPEPLPEAASVKALTRRRTRNGQGVYRSSVLTPGEVEFIVRKREERCRTSLGQRRVTRSCTEFMDGEKVFVTQDGADYGGSESARNQYSRMTCESRVSIVPSPIHVTLPAQQQRETTTPSRRAVHRKEPQRRPTATAVADGDELSPPPTSALLCREKAVGNHIWRCSVRERRRREQRRQEQKFILKPMAGLDWCEAQGLQTPTVLHKYLQDSFYANNSTTKTTTAGGDKPGVDTAALLSYIRHKQKHATYIPPPPSSGSGDEEEEEDADYQEVRFDTSGADGYKPLKAVDNAQDDGARLATSGEELTTSKPYAPPPPATSLYVLDRNPPPQGHVTQDHAYHESSGAARRRSQRENGAFDLLVGGDRVTGSTPGTLSRTFYAREQQLAVNGVSNLQIDHLRALSHAGNKQHQEQPKPHLAVPIDTMYKLRVTSPEQGEREEQKELQEQEEVGESLKEDGDSERSSMERADTTKRITVVLPSSDTSIKAEPTD